VSGMATSQRASKSALAAARGGIAKFDVFAMRFHGIIVIEPYHAIFPYKTTGRPSGKGPARLTHAQEMTHMRKLVISCHCITGLSNRIPPKLIFAGLIPRLAVL
jgi:hypothetical protein